MYDLLQPQKYKRKPDAATHWANPGVRTNRSIRYIVFKFIKAVVKHLLKGEIAQWVKLKINLKFSNPAAHRCPVDVMVDSFFLSCSSRCSTTGITKSVVSSVLSVGLCIKDSFLLP